MTVVEDDFLDKCEYHELKDNPVKRRQFSAEATAAPPHRYERQIYERNSNDRLIEDHHHNDTPQPSTVNLQPVWFKLLIFFQLQL